MRGEDLNQNWKTSKILWRISRISKRRLIQTKTSWYSFVYIHENWALIGKCPVWGKRWNNLIITFWGSVFFFCTRGFISLKMRIIFSPYFQWTCLILNHMYWKHLPVNRTTYLSASLYFLSSLPVYTVSVCATSSESYQ